MTMPPLSVRGSTSGVAAALAALLTAGCSHPRSAAPVPVAQDLPPAATEPAAPPVASVFASFAEASDALVASGSAPETANHAAIIDDAREALVLRIHLIRSARRSIDIQTFIWTDDTCGRLVMRELIRAGRRGVRVRILADSFGAEKDVPTLARLATLYPNLQIRIHRPAANRLAPGIWRIVGSALAGFRDVNQRMHNKVMVFDGEVGLTGGRNVEDTYFGQSPGMNFKDRDIVVVGPAAAAMASSFEEYWMFRHSIPAAELTDVAMAIRDLRENGTAFPWNGETSRFGRRIIAAADDVGSLRRGVVARLVQADRAEFAADPPGKRAPRSPRAGSPQTRRLIATIREARESVVIQSPYVVPGRQSRRLFADLRERAPDLEILVSTNSLGSTDNLLAYAGNLRARRLMLREIGAHVHEYRRRPGNLGDVLPDFHELRQRASSASDPFVCLHAKSLVVDHRIGYVGSFNFDRRSANLNTEAGLLFEDPELAAALEAEIRRDASAANSFVIAPRRGLPGINHLAGLSEEVLDLAPIDLKPLHTTGAFDLKPGMTELTPDHPDFYDHYRDVGPCPGAPDPESHRRLLVELLRTLTKSATPLL